MKSENKRITQSQLAELLSLFETIDPKNKLFNKSKYLVENKKLEMKKCEEQFNEGKEDNNIYKSR